MRGFLVALAQVVFLAAACAPSIVPEAPEDDVPAGPLLQALDERRQSFSSLRAIASATAFRRSRRVSFDSVGILLRSDGRFRVEAYSPLGQPLVRVVWNGETAAILRDGRLVPVPGRAALERYLGADVAPEDLAFLLTGNLPPPSAAEHAAGRCGDGQCAVELSSDDRTRRFRFASAENGAAGIRPVSYEMLRNGHLLLRARYSDIEPWSGYPLPGTVAIENPDRGSGITLTYEERDVNIAIDDSVFSLEGDEP